jgi:iron complex transport system ATP-binding protein
LAVELELRGVTVEAGGKRLLDDVSLRVREGEFVALLGPNGAGKTTLIRTALGLLPASGHVLLDGKPVRSYGGRERAGLAAWLPQQAMISEALSALDFVAGARFRFHESRATSEREATTALRQVGAVDFAARAVTTLSGGEQQRVAMAALLAQEAPLLLLDEPANHLDPGQQVGLYRLFGELWRAGRGILCITHDVNLIGHLGSPGQARVVGLTEGRISFDTHYDSPDLAAHLEALFDVEIEATQVFGRTAYLPGGSLQ